MRRTSEPGTQHLDNVSRLTEAVHRQAPQLRFARAECRGVERAAGKVAQQQIKTLRAHGFNQRPRFEQVVDLERNEPLSWPPLHSEDGFRTPAEATDEDVRLARRCQGFGGTRC